MRAGARLKAGGPSDLSCLEVEGCCRVRALPYRWKEMRKGGYYKYLAWQMYTVVERPKPIPKLFQRTNEHERQPAMVRVRFERC